MTDWSPNTAAGRLQMIQDMMDTNVYDNEGNVIGQQEPLITPEQARALMDGPSEPGAT